MSLRRVPVPLPPCRFTHRFYASHTTPVTIGIRREDPGRKWERRAPLTPDAVAELVSHDKVRVLIQECERRVFPVDEYIRVRNIRVLHHHNFELIAKRLNHTGRCRGAFDARACTPSSWHQRNAPFFSYYEPSPLNQTGFSGSQDAHDVLTYNQRPRMQYAFAFKISYRRGQVC
jgi:hypothetical protein